MSISSMSLKKKAEHVMIQQGIRNKNRPTREETVRHCDTKYFYLK